jgi:uncharacterized membrane protein (DUF2068 family)
VTILAILAAIGGVLGLLGGIAALGVGGAVAAGGLGGLLAIVGIVAIVQALLALAFAYGAWTLKPWGWTLGIVAEGIGIALSILFVINGSSITSQIISIAIAGAIIYYLMTPNVKAAFGRA